MNLYSKFKQWMDGPSKKRKSEANPGQRLERGDREVLGVERVHTLDMFMDIRAVVSFECYGNAPVGAFLLQRKDEFRVVFGFDAVGFHSFALEDELEDAWHSVITATKLLPEGDLLGIRLSSFKQSSDRIEALYHQIQQCPNPAIDSLLMAEMKNVEVLANKGLREPKNLEFFPSYRPRVFEETDSKSDASIEAAVGFLDWLYKQYKGDSKQQQSRAEFKTFLTSAYSQGFQNWVDIFTQTIGVEVKPKSPEQMWAFLWRRFNKIDPIPCPYTIRFIHDSWGTKLEGSPSKKHITYYLQHECTPQFDQQYVRLDRYNPLSEKIERNYIGALKFDDKLEGWENGYHQLRFFWDLLTNDGVSDTEVFIQLGAENKSKAAKEAHRLYQQAMLDVQNASEKSRLHSRGEQQIEEARNAVFALSRGDCPCRVGAFILIHRPNLQELERACQELQIKLTPHKISRERDVAYRLWTQSFFCDFSPLLFIKGVGDLRVRYQAHEVPGLFPLINTLKGDRDGVEFIARDGGTPYHLQLFKQGREVHFGLVAGHRSGKSETAIGIIIDAQSRGIPVTVLDYPAKDGRSSFYHFSQYIGGEYLDIGKESINILEIIDLRGLPKELQAQRFQDFMVFINRELMALLNPDPNDYQLKQAVDDILVSAIREFYSDAVIQQRYEAALDAGFGSDAWQDMPTLRDFAQFCIPERIPVSKNQLDDDSQQRAFKFINRRLTAKLAGPLGRAIAEPSTIRTNAKFTVFALRSLDDEDSAVFSLAAFSLAARRSLESSMSLVIFDEAQQLAGYESICDLAKTYVTTGGKQGIRCGFITNDFEALAGSKAGSTILSGLNVKLIGRLETDDARKVGKAFDIKPEIMKYTSSAKFKRDVKNLRSSWIIVEDSKVTFAFRYPAPQTLSLNASNLWEADVREAYFQHYGHRQGLLEFSEVHIHALQNGETLEIPDFAQPRLEVAS